MVKGETHQRPARERGRDCARAQPRQRLQRGLPSKGGEGEYEWRVEMCACVWDGWCVCVMMMIGVMGVLYELCVRVICDLCVCVCVSLLLRAAASP